MKEKLNKNVRKGLVNSRDTKLNYLYANMVIDKTAEAQIAFTYEVNRRKSIDHIFKTFANSMTATEDQLTMMLPTKFDCLRMMVDTYTEHCGSFNDYEMKYGSYFVAACELFENSNISIQNELISACKN
jgi:hypothetical protein